MTYENCLKYAKEARLLGDEAGAEFWEKRAEKRRVLNKLPEVSKPVIPEPVKVEEVVEEKEKPKSKRGKK